LSGRGLCDELITRPEESYRLCCVVVCDLETSRMGAPYIHDISHLRVNHGSDCCELCIWKWQEGLVACSLRHSPHHLLWRRETLCSGEVNGPAAPTTFDSRTSEYGVLPSTPFWGKFWYSNRNCVIVLRSKFFPVPRKYSNGKCQ